MKISIVVIIVFAASACTVVGGPAPTNTMEATYTATVIPTDTPQPTATGTTEPTATPTPEPLVSQEMINRLANELGCDEEIGCIFPSAENPGQFNVEMLSTGKFEEIPLYDENSENILGTLTVLTLVGEDRGSNPFVVRLITQVELNSDPGVNVYAGFMKMVIAFHGGDHRTYDGMVKSLEEWSEAMPKGSFWRMVIDDDGAPDGFRFLDGTNLRTEEYVRQMREFIESGGAITPSFPLIPFGMSTFRGM